MHRAEEAVSMSDRGTFLDTSLGGSINLRSTNLEFLSFPFGFVDV